MCVLTRHLSTFVSMFAPCEGCLYICVFTGKLNVLVRAHHSAVNICPSSLSVFAAEGWGAQAGQHWSSLCWEKLGMKLKLPSKARASTATLSSTIHTPRRGWWCLHHSDDNRTQRRQRETEEEKESLSPPSTVPLTCHHLYCQGPSARLEPAWAPINHCSAGRREAGVNASHSQPLLMREYL